MGSILRGKLTYANVMATIAVFLALGGVGYAATQLPKNSVGSKQLKNGAVTPTKISKAVKSQLQGAGQAGPAGPAGEPGAPGSALGYAYVTASGEFDPAKSKGIVDVRPPCSGGAECTLPPPKSETTEFCFKLSFTPHVANVEPVTGRVYAYDAATATEAKIPAPGFSEIYGGCAPGYRDTLIRVSKGGEAFEIAHPGFFVIFN